MKKDKKKKKQETENKSLITVGGIGLRRLFAYLVIYSFIGYVVETLYAVVAKGVVESRRSFLYLPVCAIYGVGAIFMLIPLKKLKFKRKSIYFLVSAIIGCAIEYTVSWFGEIVLRTKWWDYSNYYLNINGRTCVYFGIFWGILGVLLITTFNPKVDNFIDKVKRKIPSAWQSVIVTIANVVLVLDMVLATMAVDCYQTRVVIENNIKMDRSQMDYYVEHYDYLYGNPERKSKILSIWGNEYMIKAYPNLRLNDADGNIIYLSSFYPEIQSYYFKVFDKEKENVDPVRDIAKTLSGVLMDNSSGEALSGED